MKNYLLALFILAAFAQACATKTETPANNGVSNVNAVNNNTISTNTEKSTEKAPANGDKKISANTEKPKGSTEKTERVQFATGKTDTSLTRTIAAKGSIDLVINARKGQRMEYSVNYDKGSDTDVEMFLSEPGLQDVAQSSEANQPNEFMINKTGDHRITVNNVTGKPITVRFGVVIK